MAEKFVLPTIIDHPTGWGPLGGVDKYEDVPFSSFSKGDRLGKISDWNFVHVARGAQNRPNQPAALGTIATVATASTTTNTTTNVNSTFNFNGDEDEAFSLVDTKNRNKNKFRRFQPSNQGNNQSNQSNSSNINSNNQNNSNNASNNAANSNKNQVSQRQQQQQRRQAVAAAAAVTQKPTTAAAAAAAAARTAARFASEKKTSGTASKKRLTLNVPMQEIKDQSLKIEDTWQKVAEFEFPKLKTLSEDAKDPVDLVDAGAVYEFKKNIEQIAPNTAIKIRATERVFPTTTTSEDPVLQKLMSEDKGNVYLTDSILTTLMTAPRSVYPWDIVVRKEGEKVIFDKRADSRLDFYSVNENFNDNNERDALNHPYNLSTEAAYINQNFSQTALNVDAQKKLEYSEANPFTEAEAELAPIVYRYRSWELKDQTFVVRCEANAFATTKEGAQSLVSVKALNEYDPKVTGGSGWKRTLGTQPTAVFATEMKTNACKLSKWAAQALLVGAEQIKIGFVSRTNFRDPSVHEVLKVLPFPTTKLVQQLSLTANNMWGIVGFLVAEIRKLEDGKYFLVKDKEPKLKIYRVSESDQAADKQ